jgi:hypothetical protein
MTLHASDGVDLVDLHPEVLGFLDHFAAVNRDLARNSRCRKIAEDGRVWLRRAGERYDVLTLEPMPPQHAGMTQLYSVEFYEAARRVLAPDGVVCQWLPWHLLAPEQALAMVRAMAEVFPTVLVFEHRRTGILIGSPAPELVIDATRFDAFRDDPGIGADLVELGITGPRDLVEGFVCSAMDVAPSWEGIAPVRDDDPSLEYAEIGYGLTLLTPEEEAAVRAPFFAARLKARPPLAEKATAQARAIERDFAAESLLRYGSYLLRRDGPARAARFLEEELRARPELASHAAVREFEAAVRAVPAHTGDG